MALCTSSVLALAARLNDMAARAAEPSWKTKIEGEFIMNPADGYTRDDTPCQQAREAGQALAQHANAQSGKYPAEPTPCQHSREALGQKDGFDVAGNQPGAPRSYPSPLSANEQSIMGHHVCPVDVTGSVCAQQRMPTSRLLRNALLEAKEAHSAMETATGLTDDDWALWYGLYLAHRGWRIG